MKDHEIGIIVLLGIIAVLFFGGARNQKSASLLSPQNTSSTTESSGTTLAEQRADIQKQIDDLKLQLLTQENAKANSIYKGVVTLASVSRSTKSSSEYVTLRMASDATTTVDVSGWTLRSLVGNISVTIPRGTGLYYSGQVNGEEDIILKPGDTIYVVTGRSPIGYSFRNNKCSGYLGKYQTYVPYISNSCPRASNEDLSSIPHTPANFDCLDYIDSYGSCKTQTDPLPSKWTAECRAFIYDKLNYTSCINTHKNDADFFGKEWRAYLNRDNVIWRTKHEDILLYDRDGKIVSEYKY